MAPELLRAASAGDLLQVQFLLAEGAASIGEVDMFGCSALLLAAENGHTEIVQWLLAEGGANIAEVATVGNGYTSLLLASANGQLTTAKWLLEHGASIDEVTTDGKTVWDLLKDHLIASAQDWIYYVMHDDATIIALLRVLVLRGAPPPELAAALSSERALVVQEGARLRDRLPAYLLERQTRLGECCSLITPLRALVHGYEEPTTTEELWATGLGAAP
jgi:ankyrin repeat protein